MASKRICSQCASPLTEDEARRHAYVMICAACWNQWNADAVAATGVNLRRYGQRATQRKYPPQVCYPCGMVFLNVPALHVHRTGDHCQPPSFLFEKKMTLNQEGVWVLPDNPLMIKVETSNRRKLGAILGPLPPVKS